MQFLNHMSRVYGRAVRLLVLGLAAVGGAAILVMTGVTCLDVVLRAVGHPFPGAVDIVRLAGATAIACALPYTTAVKGHVAVEFFFRILGRRGRVAVDTGARLVAIALFGVLARQCFVHGTHVRTVGEVTTTLQLPMFWVLYLMAASCAVVVLVILHNLLHPGKEMIKP